MTCRKISDRELREIGRFPTFAVIGIRDVRVDLLARDLLAARRAMRKVVRNGPHEDGRQCTPGVCWCCDVVRHLSRALGAKERK